MIPTLVILAALGYAVPVLAAAAILLRKPGVSPRPDAWPAVAVVVAARNEEDTIGECLECLARQDYPETLTRIVVVDDHSEDATADIVRSYCLRDERFSSVGLADAAEPPGKAAALAAGIESVTAEVLLTTDADCQPPPHWVRSMVSLLLNRNLGCLGGPTRVSGSRLFDRTQSLEWMLGFAIFGASSEVGHPITAMGNNMAFRRNVYDSVGGYRRFMHSPTEDYELFRAIARRSPGSAELFLAPEVLTVTRPAASLSQAASQRRRWASGGLRGSLRSRAVAGIVWLAHALPLVGLALAPQAAVLGLAAKVIADAALLAAFSRRTSVRVPWSALYSFEIFAFFYITLLPISLVVAPTPIWKGRTVDGHRGRGV